MFVVPTETSPSPRAPQPAQRGGARQALLALSLSTLVALAAVGASSPAAAAPVSDNLAVIALAGKPSEWLVASDEAWKAPLAAARPLMDARRANWATLKPAEQIEWHIHSAVLAQAEGRWKDVLASVDAARALQPSPAGRQTAGLLNELLARQALARGDEAALRQLTRDTVLAMNWSEVEPAIQSIRQALSTMERQGVQNYVESRMDLTVGITKGQVTVPFLMQLLGARFQVQQVLPHRAALMLGLDDALRQRAAAPTPATAPAPAASSAS
ncbi:hypothetical protein [Roseateles sp. BYS87W]|uniref:Uncharacterized protein n=1 Tax=Pelomonas baiyunensis TaxID=3299026 RepID=A0ABW7H3L1_9BURK